MVKFVVTLLVLISALATSVAQERSCVRIGTNNGIGSGTVIARKGKLAMILTNAHVIPNGNRKIYVISGGERHYGTYVASMHPDDTDLALVIAEVPNPAAKIAQDKAAVGTKIRHFGGATGPQRGVIEGQTDWVYNGVVNPCILANIFSIVGDSGAAYFNEEGEIVGVHNARQGDLELNDMVANGVRLDKVHSFVNPYLKGWERK